MLKNQQLNSLSDRELLAEARTYQAALAAAGASLNFTGAELEAVTDAGEAFEETIDQWDAVCVQKAAIRTKKTNARKVLLDVIRAQRRRLYADTSLPRNAIASAGLPERDAKKTRSPNPETAPFGWLEYSKLRHTIHFRDTATPDRRAKPFGMDGCEIWHFIGDEMPTSFDDFAYLETAKKTPFVHDYKMANAGKKVFYLLRWKSKNGERGEWSAAIEATING